VDSDHLPLEVELSTEEERIQEEEQKRMAKEEEREIVVWDVETRQKYRGEAEELIRIEMQKEREELSIEEKWERIMKVINEAMIRCKKKWRRKEIGYKNWWDRSCRKKREVKRIHRRWRKGKTLREKYMEEKRKFNLWVMEKQREKREKEEEDLKRSKTEIWRYINRKCGKKNWGKRTRLVKRNGEIIL